MNVIWFVLSTSNLYDHQFAEHQIEPALISSVDSIVAAAD